MVYVAAAAVAIATIYMMTRDEKFRRVMLRILAWGGGAAVLLAVGLLVVQWLANRKETKANPHADLGFVPTPTAPPFDPDKYLAEKEKSLKTAPAQKEGREISGEEARALGLPVHGREISGEEASALGLPVDGPPKK